MLNWLNINNNRYVQLNRLANTLGSRSLSVSRLKEDKNNLITFLRFMPKNIYEKSLQIWPNTIKSHSNLFNFGQ